MIKLLAKTNSTSKLAFAGLSMSFLAAKTRPNVFDTIITVLSSIFADLFAPIFEIIATLVLTVYRWVLTMIDLAFVLIRQMGGLNVDFSSFESIAEGDIIFKFMSNEIVVDVLKGLMGLAVAVIIVLGIIAIIKSEFSAVADTSNSGEIKNDKWPIWKRIFQSLLLLILVPVVFIGGLIFSNAVLQTLINATAGKENMSLGAQVFLASSYEANAYRIYAERNLKIPITYDFSQIKDYTAVTDWDTSGTVKEIAEAMEAYKQADEWTQGYATFEMFYQKAFFNMDDIDYIQHYSPDENNMYAIAYDKGIKTYRYEYFVNADLLDYLLRYGQQVRIVSAQEAYESCLQAGVQLDIHKTGQTYEFYVNYADEQDAIKYVHPANSLDEADGAVFLICLEKEYQVNANEVAYYYEPITANNSKFKTHYLENGSQYVVAKGFFESGEFPTAIRQEESGEIKFYREKLNVPTFGSFFPHISYELPEGSTEVFAVKAIKSAVQLFTGIDVSQFVPYVYFDLDLSCLFSKITNQIATLENGKYYIDYGFTSPGMDIEFVYEKLNINFIILVIAGTLILSRCAKAFFGVLKRSVDIMFLYLVYPAAVATIPLYENSNFSKWVKQMTGKVLGLYGLIIGINLALILIPIAADIELFVPGDFANTMFGIIPNATAEFFNYIFQLIFTLVGISFIFEISGLVQEFVGSGSDIVKDGGEVIEGSTEIYKNAAEAISGKKLLDSVRNITGYTDPKTGEYHAGWIPGTAAIGAVKHAKEAKFGREKNAEQMEAKTAATKNKMQEALNSAKASKESKTESSGDSSGDTSEGGSGDGE